ncbi:putative reverse transcriptase domain-containing protein [Tanacetum coccineum]
MWHGLIPQGLVRKNLMEDLNLCAPNATITKMGNVLPNATSATELAIWPETGDKQEAAFQLLKEKLCSAPILALPEGAENFIIYFDASHKGLGAVLMQNEKVISYASRQLKIHEKNYTTMT